MAVIQDFERKNKKFRLIYACIFIFLFIGVFVQFLPLAWMAIGTFKTNSELVSAIPKVFPAHWSLDSYKETFQKYKVWQNIYNTAFICFFIIVFQTVTSTLAAYALSKVKPKCGNFVYMVLLGTQMFSVTALLFPTYIMFSKLGFIGSKWSWILSSSAWAYAIVLYKSFFDGIPKDLIEAADIDGANTLQKIRNVIVPLSKPVFVVNILNTFMIVYNDFLFPLMLLPDEEDWTVMIRIFMMDKAQLAPQNVMYVLLFVACIPSILFYLLGQKNIQSGISTAGIKG